MLYSQILNRTTTIRDSAGFAAYHNHQLKTNISEFHDHNGYHIYHTEFPLHPIPHPSSPADTPFLAPRSRICSSPAKSSAETRYIVSIALQSVHNYSEDDNRPLIDEKHLKAVAYLSDSLMALASRLEVDLKNQVWTSNVLSDVRKMYSTRIVFKLTSFLLDTAGNDPRSVVITVRVTLEDSRCYLATSTIETIGRGIATTARKYRI